MMNDWGNDNLKIGDLVILHATGPGYMRDLVEDNGIGMVVRLETPPRGSLQTYDVEVLTSKGVVTTYRQHIEKIND